MSVPTISPQQLHELWKAGKIDLLDVRTPVEFRELHAVHARNLPLDRLDPVALMQARSGSRDEPLYVMCRSGSRGRQACEKFLAAGFPNVVNVEGGTLAADPHYRSEAERVQAFQAAGGGLRRSGSRPWARGGAAVQAAMGNSINVVFGRTLARLRPEVEVTH